VHTVDEIQVLQLLMQVWQILTVGYVELGHDVTQYPSK